MVGQTASAARRNQQQQLVQSVAGLYIPGAGQPYAQQLVSQYQVNDLDEMTVDDPFTDASLLKWGHAACWWGRCRYCQSLVVSHFEKLSCGRGGGGICALSWRWAVSEVHTCWWPFSYPPPSPLSCVFCSYRLNSSFCTSVQEDERGSFVGPSLCCCPYLQFINVLFSSFTDSS